MKDKDLEKEVLSLSKGNAGNRETKNRKVERKEMKKQSRQDVQKVMWCGNFHNWDEDDKKLLIKFFQDNCKNAIMGEEEGSGGDTPHLQFAFKLIKRKRLTEFKNMTGPISKAHLNDCQGNWADNIRYCTKEYIEYLETRGENDARAPWTMRCSCIFPPKLIEERALYTWQKEIIEIISRPTPEDRKIYWYWSGSGGVGKTAFQKYISYWYDEQCCMLSGKANDVKHMLGKWIDRKDKHPHIILYPIPMSYNIEYVSYEGIESIKDMFCSSGKYEGAEINGNEPNMFVFANSPPDFTKMDNARWYVREIVTNESSFENRKCRIERPKHKLTYLED